MAKKAVKKSKTQLRSIACKHLEQLNEISNAGNPLCYCQLRDFNVSPYNHVCQICAKYSENVSGITHAEMFVAEAAANFVFDMDQIIAASDLVEEIDDTEDEIVPKKKAKSKKKVKKVKGEVVEVVEDDDDDDDDEIEVVEEDEELVIGHEKEEKEDLSYQDEREEGTGKRHGPSGTEDDEDEELDEELDELDDESESSTQSNDDLDTSGIDFETDVIAKIKKTGVGEDIKEICPFCQKSKLNVLRHLPKCKRCPPEMLKAHAEWKKQKPKSKGSKKSTKKKKSTKSKK